MSTECAERIKAALLGKQAFESGRKRIPAHEPDLMKLIGAMPHVQVGDSIPILDAWLAAWDAANLCKKRATQLPKDTPVIVLSGPHIAKIGKVKFSQVSPGPTVIAYHDVEFDDGTYAVNLMGHEIEDL